MSEDTTLDMMELARFAVLPGANRIVRAMIDIPPGPMRDSVIHHAEVIASQYTGTVAPPGPPPINHRSPPPQLVAQTRTGRTPPTEGPEAQIIEMALSGEKPKDIAAALRLEPHKVYDTIRAARTAGIDLPKRVKGPLPPGTKTWFTTVEEIVSEQARGRIERAANDRGIAAQAYLDRRVLALQMARDGASYAAILEATGELSAKVISAWLSAARNAGLDVPYVGIEPSISLASDDRQQRPA